MNDVSDIHTVGCDLALHNYMQISMFPDNLANNFTTTALPFVAQKDWPRSLNAQALKMVEIMCYQSTFVLPNCIHL